MILRINQLFIGFLFLIVGCFSFQTDIDELLLKQGKYYYTGSSELFSGKAISKFDNGNTSNVIELKNGIPDGKWIAYGYKSEIVQEGNYIPIDISADSSFKGKDIFRLNLFTTKEGDLEFTDALIITATPTKFKENEFKPIINTYLKKHKIGIKGDTLNQIKFLRGEFDIQ